MFSMNIFFQFALCCFSSKMYLLQSFSVFCGSIDAYSAAAVKVGPCSLPGSRVGGFGGQVILPLAHTIEHEEVRKLNSTVLNDVLCYHIISFNSLQWSYGLLALAYMH